MKRFLTLLIVILVVSSCSHGANCDDAQDTSCTRILFIGNSYTFVNDLPKMFAELAESGGHKAEVGMAAKGGWRLADHLQAPQTLDQLQSKKWNFVVLQEQSEIPALEQTRWQQMYPAARDLVAKIRGLGITPIFFDTWAHRDGLDEYGPNDYQSMQQQIDSAYLGIAQELNVSVAPVGSTWLTAMKQHPELELWKDDGTHPSEEGTYLAACVFYAVIFHESSAGLTYYANLSEETAQMLQTIASKTVLNIP